MISALPVSGAWQPKMIGAHDDEPEDLVQQRELELAVALTAQLRAQVRGPELLVADLLLERIDDRLQLGAGRRERQPAPEQVERLDLLAHEVPGPVELGLEVGFGLEIPCHGGNPLCSAE